MLKTSNIALLSAALLSITALASGCADNTEDAKDSDESANLGTDEAQLMADDAEAADADESMEAAVDDALSGAPTDEPAAPATGASDEAVLEQVRANAGKHFLSKCLQSTRDGNKIHHVFKACRTAWSLETFEGEVDSTYVRDGNKLTITHAFDGFLANGASLSGTRVIAYSFERSDSGGVVISKVRTGTLEGETKKGTALSHTANFSASYDSAAKCVTREGSAQTTIGGRTFERVLTGYKRCGIGARGCPDAGGKLTLTKTNDAKDKEVSVSIEFLGDDKMRVTRRDGTEVERPLACNDDAS